MENNGLLSRLIYTIIFIFIYSIIKPIIIIITILQFVHVFVKSEKQPYLLDIGHSLAQYSYEIISFLTFNSEEIPFPFSSWPN
ncbi:MAG: DUF4389 domain-containing protein [Pseudomonadota bacterium]|nr:DUF4389 domain-containing protein [Pseudomonadota bacterium]